MKKTVITALILALPFTLGACEVEETGGSGASGSAESKTNYTVAQENAIESAKSYLEMSGMSRRGLIHQLTAEAGEGYKRKDAVFAINHLDPAPNWKKEAVQSAKSYLDTGSMSRAGLIQQLSSNAGEKFTRAQAEYAADKVGL
jgi:hypothetical protein